LQVFFMENIMVSVLTSQSKDAYKRYIYDYIIPLNMFNVMYGARKRFKYTQCNLQRATNKIA